MPDDTHNTPENSEPESGDEFLGIPEPSTDDGSSVSSDDGVEVMASVDDSIHAHSMSRLQQVGTSAHENFEITRQQVHYDFMESRRQVDLVEALGAREVGSKNVPAGPNSP